MKKLIISLALIFALTAVLPMDALAAETTAPQPAPAIATTTVGGYATGRGAVRVSWQAVSGAKGYVLYRSTSATGRYTAVATLPATTRVYVQKYGKVRINATYYYKVVVLGRKGTATVRSKASAPRRIKNILKIRTSFRVKAYAYTGGGVTASGKRAAVGRIAVDPRVIKLGTWMYIPGYGICQACDTGGSIKGRVVDLYMNSVSACNRWGVKTPVLYVLR